MCNISFDLNETLADEATRNAKAAGLSLDEYIKRILIERLEDENDLRELRDAKAESEADPGFVTMEEIAKKYGFKK